MFHFAKDWRCFAKDWRCFAKDWRCFATCVSGCVNRVLCFDKMSPVLKIVLKQSENIVLKMCVCLRTVSTAVVVVVSVLTCVNKCGSFVYVLLTTNY